MSAVPENAGAEPGGRRVTMPERAGPAAPEGPARERDAGAEASEREVSARGIADRVLSCPDVADLSRGPFGVVATHLPGGLVPGVAVRDDAIEVDIVARYGRPLPEVADLVRDAIGDLAGGRRVDVTIADVVTDDGGRKE
ncbi:Asp23/Gls24 family envelope stress response protein [Microbispora rosea]|uniref:Asp23/Gls24 family envelope stress response protein n=1 Tax=Microbispora rosea TaxID=58117 RepID=UPI000A75E071|nr:Asp23/Gls24 family envelope stress response protein [Microbispora rosea]